MKLTWLGHASFRLECGRVVYFDPYKVEGGGDADIILVSHGHHDHCDVKSIRSLAGEETVVVCPHSCVKKAVGNVTGLGAGDVLGVGDVRIEAHSAYNTNKPNHPGGMGLGYVVEAAGRRVYFAGDTDLIPEMGELGGIDVALLPVGGTYTMNWSEAADAVKAIRPRFAVPMHYGEVVGTPMDAVSFKRKVDAETDAKAVILKRGEPFEF
jgi:L-ascorbate metabolism protein UlaG (beta-lactamase superfamily)